MKNLKGNMGGLEGGEGKMKQDGIGWETNHKRLLISGNKLRVAAGWEVGRGWWGYGHWGGYVLW